MKSIKINRQLIFVSIFLSIVVTFFRLKVLAQTPYPGPTDGVDPYPAPNATLPASAAAPSPTTYDGIVFNPTCGAEAGWQEQRVAYLPISHETAISRQSGQALIQHWFGILDPFGNEKPAYCALQQLTGVKTVCQLSNRSHFFTFPSWSIQIPLYLRSEQLVKRSQPPLCSRFQLLGQESQSN